MKRALKALAAALTLIASAVMAVGAAEAQTAAGGATLKAGAARRDITPPLSALPSTYRGVHDAIYVRAVVVENPETRAALVSVDTGAISPEVWAAVAQRAPSELNIPADHIILSATHTHSVPRPDPALLADQIMATIAQAAAGLQPAKMRYGTGASYINVNRNIIDPQTRRWWEGPNVDGVSDKTVAVISFDTVEGRPIAVFYNYAMHAVISGQLDEVSGDVPGAASRYIEASLGGDAVALWSEGAAGDQNPIYFQQTYDLREIRIADAARRGEDISNTMLPGGQGLDRANPDVIRLMDQQRQMLTSMGQMLGEEVLETRRARMERPILSDTIAGSHVVATCPGRTRTDSGRAGYPGVYVDADPIPLRLSLVVIGDVAIGGVDAEVFNTIAQRFKAESPLKHTIMSTLTNGLAGSGYIPNDAAYGQNTFEVISSRLRPGCAERAIVDGLLDQLQSVRVVWR